VKIIVRLQKLNTNIFGERKYHVNATLGFESIYRRYRSHPL